MKQTVDGKICVIVPNWNGLDSLGACLDSLLNQSLQADVIVVENGSIDGSVEFLAERYPHVTTLRQSKNHGFAGGVNIGINYASEKGYDFIALFNNDAVADSEWLRALTQAMADAAVGITTCTFASIDKLHIDSTGDLFTNWGLPYPRGRGEPLSDRYNRQTDIFAASGGASLYRVAMLKKIGLFDEDFFAYYEDVDLSFRAQLAGWKVRFAPEAVAYHQISATSSKIKGFATLQTMKNQPMLVLKNVPNRYLWSVGLRFSLAYVLFFGRAISRGQGWPALKGVSKGMVLLPQTLAKRRNVQRNKTVTDTYIWSIMTHDLPPNAHNLRNLRSLWWKISRRRAS